MGLGANAIRIQAKNNNTLTTIQKGLEDLQKQTGPFRGVRVSQAVRTGMMKKGVNVLLVFDTVQQAFDSVKIMYKQGFKVQTVIPRRLRATYGIAENGMELTKPVHKIPIEIKEDDLPEDLRRPPQQTTGPAKKDGSREPKQQENGSRGQRNFKEKEKGEWKQRVERYDVARQKLELKNGSGINEAQENALKTNFQQQAFQCYPQMYVNDWMFRFGTHCPLPFQCYILPNGQIRFFNNGGSCFSWPTFNVPRTNSGSYQFSGEMSPH